MITKNFFGKTKDNKNIYAYRLNNSKGESVNILDLGGIIQSIKVFNNKGGLTDVALGFDTVSEYQNNEGYLGALIGRYANRIAGGEFFLNGKKYTLYKNDGENHLHGGKEGYDKRIWQAQIEKNKLILKLNSPHGEEGYPSEVDITVTYTFSDSSELGIEYHALASDDTVINLTNHCYFNLNGCGDILNHVMKINSEYYTPTDGESIPTGEIKSVNNTPFDFREYKTIGQDIEAENIQLIQAKGYDHNYVLGKGYKQACTVYSRQSGIIMDVFTDNEGIQFYSGNYLNNLTGKCNGLYGKRYGFCLESQHYPDSPNKPQFPSPVLKKGEVYNFKTTYKFSVK